MPRKLCELRRWLEIHVNARTETSTQGAKGLACLDHTALVDPLLMDAINQRVLSLRALLPPSCVFEELPGNIATYTQVIDTRQAIINMVAGKDDRLLVVVGPAGATADLSALRALAAQLSSLSSSLSSELVIVLRADACMSLATADQVNKGIRRARELLLEINGLGVPTAIEFRDTITPQFFADLLAWANVSARSEAMRELVSGLSMPVGVRAPSSDVASAVRAIDISGGAHHFLGVSVEGVCGVVKSTGHPDVFAMLPADGAAAGDGFVGALRRLHEQRPQTALVLELGADGTSVTRACEEICRGGTLGARLIGVDLRLAVEGASAGGALDATRLHALAASVTKRRRERLHSLAATTAAAPTETHNLRISAVSPLLPPACLLEELPRTEASAKVVGDARRGVHKVLTGASDRLIVLLGPAAVDDPAVALEYGARLVQLAREVADELLVVMRVEINTPVTPSTGPWPGLLFDPARDGSYEINKGIRQSRELLLQLNALGLPCALEFRDTITPQFFADLLAWASVDAGSETLRELVSGLSMPVGVRAPKLDGGTSEDVSTAAAAVAAGGTGRHFLGVTSHGLAGIVQSTGNRDIAITLDGGSGVGTQRAAAVLAACAGSTAPIVAQCGGSDPAALREGSLPGGGASDGEQIAMASAVAAAVAAGQPTPCGLSLNSYLLAGAAPVGAPAIRGLSLTEPCVDWLATEQIVHTLAEAVRTRRERRGPPADDDAKKRQRGK